MKFLVALLAGLLFGAGLILGGMTDPDRVIGFLDWTGRWDPSLAFVMGGAVLAAVPLYAIVRRRGIALSGDAPETPPASGVDRSLVIGAALFGAGWGLVGICPGPAFVLLGVSLQSILLFALAMLSGLMASKLVRDRGQ